MEHWKYLQFSRRGIAVDPRTGESFRINETAGMILTSLQRNIAPQDIANAIVTEYDVAFETALSDVYDFIANLNIQGVGE